MRVKTKIGIFIGAVFVVLILGLFAGKWFAAVGATAIGILGAGWSGSALKRAESATKSADQSATAARKEASTYASSMDRLVQSGDDLAAEGSGLVAESEKLIREAGLEPRSTNKQSGH